MFVSAKKLLLSVGALLILSGTAVAMDDGTDGLSSKLYRAAADGNLEKVKRLVLEKYIDVNFQGSANITALHQAAETGKLETVQWLVEEAGAKVNLEDYLGRKPLHAAATGGHLPVVRWLVTEGHTDLDQPDRNDRTALCWSAMLAGDRNMKVTRWLLDQGADPAALENPAWQLNKGREDIDRLLQERGRYVRDARQATRDVLIPQNSQWETLLPLLHKSLGWHVIDIQEKSSGKHDDEIQEMLEKLTAGPKYCHPLSCGIL